MASPTPKKKKVNSLTFYQALEQAYEGHRVTRLDWNDENEYGFMLNNFLSIHTKGQDHTWIISYQDMIANDWVIVLPKN